MKSYKKISIILLTTMCMTVGCGNADLKSNNSKEIEVQSMQEEVVEKQEVEKIEAKEEAKEKVKEEVVEIKEINYQEVKPNEVGTILVAMYHGLADEETYNNGSKDFKMYQRKIEDFKKDLNYMYEHGYRPISIRDYVDNNITVEAGFTPIVLTFDDGLQTAFSLEQENNEYVVAKDTAVSIMDEFAKEHPDFGKAATFYINGNQDAFGEVGTLEERIKFLVNDGYGVGNHTRDHANLYELDGQNIQEQIGTIDQDIKKILPDYKVDTIALPFGSRPKEELRKYLEEGEFDGQKYSYNIAFRVGYSAPYVSVNNVKFSPYNHPRVTASDMADWDMWYAFDYFDNQYPSMKYISDGKPNRIAVPKSWEERVNKDSLLGKELFIYEK